MGLPRSRPSDTLLDLLRAAGPRGRSARSLVSVAEIFGLTGNAVRVTLSRLVARGLVDSPTRGHYCLATQANALNDFVERWRLGEARVRPWRPGEWLFAHPQDERPGTRWALEALGFRAVRAGLYARPDNLALAPEELRAIATGIGLSSDTLVLAGQPQGECVTDCWQAAWHPAALDAGYAETTARLQASAARLRQMPAEQARLESFLLGGEAIHKLAKDPLLPVGFVDVRARHGLWQAMIEYETLGKSIWSGAFREPTHTMPIPQLAAGG